MKKKGKKRDGEPIIQVWIKETTKQKVELYRINKKIKTFDKTIIDLLKKAKIKK